MSELESSSSGASDYDKISGIEPLSQSSSSQSSSHLKSDAKEKYVTTGRLSENSIPTVTVPLHKPPEKKLKGYFTKNSTVIQYTSGGHIEGVPVVKATLAGVKDPPASWSSENTASLDVSASSQGSRPKGARVKLFQEGSDTANTSLSEATRGSQWSVPEPTMASVHAAGDSDIIVVPGDNDDNQSQSSIDQAINRALERRLEEDGSSESGNHDDDEASEDQDVSQPDISQNSFTSSSRNDSAMDESIDRSDYEGAQALAEEYIIQAGGGGYQDDDPGSDDGEFQQSGHRDPSEFSALHLDVSSEISHMEPPELRPYRYSDCSDINQSENTEADQYQEEMDHQSLMKHPGMSMVDHEVMPPRDSDPREQTFPVRQPAPGRAQQQTEFDSRSLQQTEFDSRLQTLLAEGATSSYPEDEQTPDRQNLTGNSDQGSMDRSLDNTAGSQGNQRQTGSHENTASSQGNQRQTGSHDNTTSSQGNQRQTGSHDNTTSSHGNLRQTGSHDNTRQSGSHDNTRQAGSHDNTRQSSSHDSTRQSGSHDNTRQSGSHDNTRQGDNDSSDHSGSHGNHDIPEHVVDPHDMSPGEDPGDFYYEDSYAAPGGMDPLSQGVDPHLLQQSLALAQAMGRSAPDGGDSHRQGQNPPQTFPQAPTDLTAPNLAPAQRPAPKMGTKGLKAGNQRTAHGQSGMKTTMGTAQGQPGMQTTMGTAQGQPGMQTTMGTAQGQLGMKTTTGTAQSQHGGINTEGVTQVEGVKAPTRAVLGPQGKARTGVKSNSSRSQSHNTNNSNKQQSTSVGSQPGTRSVGKQHGSQGPQKQPGSHGQGRSQAGNTQPGHNRQTGSQSEDTQGGHRTTGQVKQGEDTQGGHKTASARSVGQPSHIQSEDTQGGHRASGQVRQGPTSTRSGGQPSHSQSGQTHPRATGQRSHQASHRHSEQGSQPQHPSQGTQDVQQGHHRQSGPPSQGGPPSQDPQDLPQGHPRQGSQRSHSQGGKSHPIPSHQPPGDPSHPPPPQQGAMYPPRRHGEGRQGVEGLVTMVTQEESEITPPRHYKGQKQVKHPGTGHSNHNNPGHHSEHGYHGSPHGHPHPAQGYHSNQVPGPHPIQQGDQSLDLSPIQAQSEASARYLRSPGATSAMEMLHNLSMDSSHTQGSDRQSNRGASQVSTGDITHMEDLRQQLQGMLLMTANTLPKNDLLDESTDADQLLTAGYHGNPGSGDDTLSTISNSVPYFSGTSLTSMSSQLEGLLGHHGHPPHGPGNHGGYHGDVPSLVAEVSALNQRLEKERFRRKHCERQIQELQNQILELQQQLAIAVSTDRKKDFMIQQLDKTLARVVEGWKKKECDKQETINELTLENETIKETHNQQQMVLDQYQENLAHTLDQLATETHKVQTLEQDQAQQAIDQETERSRLLKALELERERLHTLEEKNSVATEQKEKIRKQFQELQHNYQEDQESWEEKETDYLQKIDEISENHTQHVELEKSRFEKQEQLLQEVQKALTASQREVQDLNIQLDTTLREKESMKVESGLMQARAENNLRKMETELRAEAEQETGERLDELYKRQVRSEEELQERHRRQIMELNAHHATEMEAALARYHDDTRRLEDQHREQCDQYDQRAEEFQSELRQLRSQNRTLESKWADVTGKLQNIMTQNVNEAMKLLKPDTFALGASIISNLNGSLYATSPMRGSQGGLPVTTMTTTSSSGLVFSGPGSSAFHKVPERTSERAQREPSIPAHGRQEVPVSQDARFTDVKHDESPGKDSEGGFTPLELDQSAFTATDLDLSQYSLGMFSQLESTVMDSHIHQQGPGVDHQAPAHGYQTNGDGQLPPSSQAPASGHIMSGTGIHGQGPVSSWQGPTSVFADSSFSAFQQLFSQAYSQAQASISEYQGKPLTSVQSDTSHVTNSSHVTNPSHGSNPDHGSLSGHMTTSSHVTESNLPSFSSSFPLKPPQSETSHSVPNNVGQGQGLHQGQSQWPGSSIVLHPPVQLTHSMNFDTALPSNQGPGFPAQPISIGSQFMPRPEIHDVSMDTSGEWQQPQRDESSRPLPSFLSSLLGQGGAPGDVLSQGGTPPLYHQTGGVQAENRSNGHTPEGTSSGTQDSNPRSENTDFMNISDKFFEHENRQQELQHYIRMLLNRPPGSEPDAAEEQPQIEEQIPIQPDKPTHTHISSDRPEVADTRHLAFSKTTTGSSKGPVTAVSSTARPGAPQDHSSPKAAKPVPDPAGTLSPKQMAEISHLLGLYRGSELPPGAGAQGMGGQREGQPPTQELVEYLRDLQERNESMQPTHDQSPPGAGKKRAGKSPSPMARGHGVKVGSPKGYQVKVGSPKGHQVKAKRSLDPAYNAAGGKTQVIRIPTGEGPAPKSKPPGLAPQPRPWVSKPPGAPVQVTAQAKPSVNQVIAQAKPSVNQVTVQAKPSANQAKSQPNQVKKSAGSKPSKGNVRQGVWK